jgi:phosphate-selective porin OprO/OprP
MRNSTKKLLALGVLSIAASAAAADVKVTTDGGFKIDAGYWCSLGGVIKLDGTIFSGNTQSKGTQFHSGMNLRDTALNLNGGLGNDLTYTLAIEMGDDRKFALEDAFITYAGLFENFTISVGQVNPGFSLENTASSKWNPFLERTMVATALGPDQGLGIAINKWSSNYSLNASLTTPKKNADTTTQRSDRLAGSARVTYAPYMDKEAAKIFQFGVSGHYERSGDTRFRTQPEARARNTIAVLDTGTFNTKQLYTWAGDIAAQNGPLYIQGEYERETATRSDDTLGKVSFHGYHGLVAYVLTGEHREFSEKRGIFGQVKPNSKCGAVEIAARYSYLNLNDKDISGGSAHNTALGVNWYLNNHVKLAGDYILSHQRGAGEAYLRNMNIIGARLQVVF